MAKKRGIEYSKFKWKWYVMDLGDIVIVSFILTQNTSWRFLLTLLYMFSYFIVYISLQINILGYCMLNLGKIP